jgi:hypothetical protein
VQVDAAKLEVLMNDRLLEQRGRAAGKMREICVKKRHSAIV